MHRVCYLCIARIITFSGDSMSAQYTDCWACIPICVRKKCTRPASSTRLTIQPTALISEAEIPAGRFASAVLLLPCSASSISSGDEGWCWSTSVRKSSPLDVASPASLDEGCERDGRKECAQPDQALNISNSSRVNSLEASHS